MYRSLLVPLDGSPLSEQVVRIACDLARRSGATLHLVHVHERYDPDPIYVEGIPVIDEELHSLGKQHERAYLEAIRDQLAAEGDLAVTATLLDPMEADGNDHTTSSMIAAYAAANNADLIVMTTHGRGGLERFWLGSVADQLVRACSAPVLLIPPAAEGEAMGVSPAFRRILIPLDGSALAEQIVEPVRKLGNLTGAEYRLLHIVEKHTLGYWGLPTLTRGLYDNRVQEQQTKAKAYLDQVAGRLQTTDLAVETSVCVAEHVASAILDVARDAEVDLIAIATHGLSGFPRLLLGSVADKMVRGTSMPMLVYRPQAFPGRSVTETQQQQRS